MSGKSCCWQFRSLLCHWYPLACMPGVRYHRQLRSMPTYLHVIWKLSQAIKVYAHLLSCHLKVITGLLGLSCTINAHLSVPHVKAIAGNSEATANNSDLWGIIYALCSPDCAGNGFTGERVIESWEAKINKGRWNQPCRWWMVPRRRWKETHPGSGTTGTSYLLLKKRKKESTKNVHLDVMSVFSSIFTPVSVTQH